MAILQVQNLRKSFGGLEVFNDVSLEVEKGEIFGIIGTNGSGKTTLFNIICGVLPADSGKVFFKDIDITGMKTWKLARMGIGRCFQTVMPFNSMTPLENAKVARASARRYDRPRESFSTDEIMELTNLKEKQNLLCKDLPLPDKKNVEIARALACNPDLILFDEVSCGLSGEEINSRMVLMKRIAEAGITVIVVEHIMLFIKEICDRVAVLHSGHIICQGFPEVVANEQCVIDAYLGGGKH